MSFKSQWQGYSSKLKTKQPLEGEEKLKTKDDGISVLKGYMNTLAKNMRRGGCARQRNPPNPKQKPSRQTSKVRAQRVPERCLIHSTSQRPRPRNAPANALAIAPANAGSGLSTRIFQAAPTMSHVAPTMSHAAHFADNFPKPWRLKAPAGPQVAPRSHWSRPVESPAGRISPDAPNY
jgi:hypothetical protein